MGPALLRVLVVLALGTAACGGEVAVYGADPFGRDPPQVGSLVGKIVTSNAGDDTLSILDPAVPGPAARLPVGFNPVELEGPHHLSADPGGRFVYLNLSFAVSGSGSGPHGVHGLGDQPGYVLKLDTQTGREVARVQVEPNPGDNTLAPDGKILYVTHYNDIGWRSKKEDSNLLAIDVERMAVKARRALCPGAHGVRLSPDGRALYATCGPDEIAAVDLADPGLTVRRVPVPGGRTGGNGCQRCPYALGVAPDGTVWVSCLGPNGGSIGRGSVEVYDPAAGAFDPVRSIPLRGRPVFAAFSPKAGGGYEALLPEQAGPGDTIHVFSAGGSGVAPEKVAAIDLPSGSCFNAHMLLVAADNRRGQLVCEGNGVGPGSLVWLDLEQRAVMGSTPTGVFPDGLVLVPTPQ